jgi:hypothetical protein
MSIDAMKLALEALEHEARTGNDDAYRVERDALRAAIEQAQEPVCDKDPQGCWSVRCQLGKICKHTTPRQWQGLTEEEIEQMMDYWSEDARSAYGGAHSANGEYVYIPDIIRDAEARLKEKNNG